MPFLPKEVVIRIQVRLPKIHPDEYELPEQCPHDGCAGDTFKPHGRKGETKAVRDTDHEAVKACRYKCSICGRTMRGYKRTLTIRNVVAATSLLGAPERLYDMTKLYA